MRTSLPLVYSSLYRTFSKRRAAVGRAENAALRIRTVRMAERRDEQPVRIPGIDLDVGDHLRIAQAEVRPGLARVGGLVHAVADGEIGPDDARAAADVDDVGVRRRHRDGADRAGGLVIEQRRPRRAEVRGAPHAAVIEADVEDVGLAGDAGERARASRARRTDRAPVHLGIKPAVDRLSHCSQGQAKQQRTSNPCARNEHKSRSPESTECILFGIVDGRACVKAQEITAYCGAPK